MIDEWDKLSLWCYDKLHLFYNKNPFIHVFGDWNNHNYKGSLNRHLAIEKILRRFQRIYYYIGDAFPLYDLLYQPMHLMFGLNCNIPLRDIALYIIWDLRVWIRIMRGYYNAKKE